jgi:hypothetical protein
LIIEAIIGKIVKILGVCEESTVEESQPDGKRFRNFVVTS